MSFQGMGKSIHPMCAKSRERLGLPHSRRSSVRMSLQPAIPWQVALPQSPPPLHRPGSDCATVVLPVENFAANGEQSLNRLSQPRGQPQRNSWIFLLRVAHAVWKWRFEEPFYNGKHAQVLTVIDVR